MKCDYCGGRGSYDPFTGPTETCPKCGGSGEMGDMLAVPNNGPLNSSSPLIARSNPYVWLAQTWDTTKHGLTAGRFYVRIPGDVPIICENNHLLCLDLERHDFMVFREEFPSKDFKLHNDPTDAGYQKAKTAYGNDPCIECGTLFAAFNAIAGCSVEFFASEDTMGIAFVKEMQGYSYVELEAKYIGSAGLYVPIIKRGR